MKREECLLETLRSPHISEKSSAILKATNTISLKVSKDANKATIKFVVQKLFKVDVKQINTLIVKGKLKRYRHRIGRRSSWKKAYVTLKKGQNLDFTIGTKIS